MSSPPIRGRSRSHATRRASIEGGLAVRGGPKHTKAVTTLCRLELTTSEGVDALPVEGDRVNIGRSALNHVVLDWDENVSRVHAALFSVSGGWIVRDLGSRNGTFVNGRPARGDRLLGDGDELMVGSTKLVFRARAAETPVEAIATTTLDLTGIRRQWQPVAQPPDGSSQSPPDTVHTRDPNTFIKEGEFWSWEYCDRTVRLKDSKGMHDLSVLLASPGTEIAAVDLAAGPSAGAVSPVRRLVADSSLAAEADAGSALDAEARLQYRQRLAELEEEIDDAEVANDPERAARARQERDFLVDELKAAFGLGRRERRLLDPAERARKAVTGRIREAITHIEAVHPELGQHLRRSVRTGAFCVYDPPAPTS